jgi:hypothetical protein
MDSAARSSDVSLFSSGRRLDLAGYGTLVANLWFGAWRADSQSAAGVSLPWFEDVSVRKRNALDGHQNGSV